jgi:hypothetical protein
MFRESRIPLIYNFNLSVLFMEEKRRELSVRREEKDFGNLGISHFELDALFFFFLVLVLHF